MSPCSSESLLSRTNDSPGGAPQQEAARGGAGGADHDGTVKGQRKRKKKKAPRGGPPQPQQQHQLLLAEQPEDPASPPPFHPPTDPGGGPQDPLPSSSDSGTSQFEAASKPLNNKVVLKSDDKMIEFPSVKKSSKQTELVQKLVCSRHGQDKKDRCQPELFPRGRRPTRCTASAQLLHGL